jgi:hypothetical protein
MFSKRFAGRLVILQSSRFELFPLPFESDLGSETNAIGVEFGFL